MYTLEQLQPLIIDWAKQRDLIHVENALNQRLKLVEECGELASAILKNNPVLAKDAIGDIFVVIVILAEQIDKQIEMYDDKCNLEAYDAIELIISTAPTPDISIGYLFNTAQALDLDVVECANLAYNEIKGREGKTVNGTFIKN